MALYVRPASPFTPSFLLALVVAFVVVLPAHAAPESDLWHFWASVDEVRAEAELGSGWELAKDSTDLEGIENTIDHSQWQWVLDRNLHTNPAGLNLFDYQSAQQFDQAQLQDYLAEIQKLDPRVYSLAEQKAYWINLYNALTVKLILDNYPVKSITKLGKGFFKFGPWDDPIANVAGKTLTLNDIEHRILRPIWKDPRIHFAVNCASIGCPNLQTTVFTAENTEELLDRAAREYLAHPRGAQFDERGRLQLSSIFDWYAEDFGGNQTDLLKTIVMYVPVGVAEKLLTYEGKITYDYDWGLNDFVESEASLEAE